MSEKNESKISFGTFKYKEIADHYTMIATEIDEHLNGDDSDPDASFETVKNLLQEGFIRAYMKEDIPLAIAYLVFGRVNEMGDEGEVEHPGELTAEDFYNIAVDAAKTMSEASLEQLGEGSGEAVFISEPPSTVQ